MLHSDVEEKYLINNLKIKVRARMNNGNPDFITDSMYVWHPKYAVKGVYPGLGIKKKKEINTLQSDVSYLFLQFSQKEKTYANFFTSLQFSYAIS